MPVRAMAHQSVNIQADFCLNASLYICRSYFTASLHNISNFSARDVRNMKTASVLQQIHVRGVKCPIFSYFFLFSEKFLFFPIFHQNSYFSYLSAVFFDFHTIFFSKLKEASKIRRISCSGKSRSCEIASLWSFPPK